MKWPITELDQENYKMGLEHLFVPESKEAKKCIENDGGMSKGQICQFEREKFDIYKRKIAGLLVSGNLSIIVIIVTNY